MGLEKRNRGGGEGQPDQAWQCSTLAFYLSRILQWKETILKRVITFAILTLGRKKKACFLTVSSSLDPHNLNGTEEDFDGSGISPAHDSLSNCDSWSSQDPACT